MSSDQATPAVVVSPNTPREPVHVANTWNMQEVVKIITYVVTALSAFTAAYEARDLRTSPLSVTPVTAPVPSQPIVQTPVAQPTIPAVNPLVPQQTPQVSPYATKDEVAKAIQDSEKRIIDAFNQRLDPQH